VDELVLVGGSTRIPAIRKQLTAMLGGKEPNCALPPEEAVARGTAIQAGALVDAKKVPVGATEAVFTRRRASAKLVAAAAAGAELMMQVN
jgi:molecular chaperone DnaK (HSP70)